MSARLILTLLLTLAACSCAPSRPVPPPAPEAATPGFTVSPAFMICPLGAQAAFTVTGAEPFQEVVAWFPGERDREQWAVTDARGTAYFQIQPVALGGQLIMFEQWTGSMEPPASVILVGN